ncbi:MAG: XdhC family protein [Bacteroidota bacterium]|nr:XdhC family protein [Bacteroidota bacterium]
MKKQLQVWQFISKSIRDNVAVMLLYVLESFGSSPGRAGFCMAVNARGEMVGSIGGGIMEHKFAEMAKEKLRHDEKDATVYKQFHDKASLKLQSGMICSGEQTNLLYRVSEHDVTAIDKLINCWQSHQSGTLTLSKIGIAFNEEAPEEDFRFVMQDENQDDWWYQERVGYKNTIHIIGAGHCALALSKLMSEMDFYIHLYDDRQNLHTYVENDFAHKKTVVSDYTALNTFISSGHNQYIVAMTAGYRTDDIVVRTLLDKHFRFFGLLGSKKKIEKMFAGYRIDGIAEELLKKLHAPVGLSINSQTPEEIAISIAAEMIQVKNSVTLFT